MGRKIQTIITIIIFILILLLIAILFAYYNKTDRNKQKVYSGEIVHEINNSSSSISVKNPTKKDSAKFSPNSALISGNSNDAKDSGELIIEPISSNEDTVLNDTENIIFEQEEIKNTNIENNTDVVKDSNTPNQVANSLDDNNINSEKNNTNSNNNDEEVVDILGNSIISSSTETSNQEKQDILNEIDDALKDLLEAVGKVKVVDETKLDASLESRGE